MKYSLIIFFGICALKFIWDLFFGIWDFLRISTNDNPRIDNFTPPLHPIWGKGPGDGGLFTFELPLHPIMKNLSAKDIEIMSPVGSYESLMAAIQGGANSVYFGIGHLNMRSKSTVNFTLDDLDKISGICRENDIRSYITLNTVIFDEELPMMRSIIDAAKKAGINAIIASDQAVIQYARETGVELHMSTQTNITNIGAVKFYSAFADVMVTARELKLEQVKEITEAIEIEQVKGPSGKSCPD